MEYFLYIYQFWERKIHGFGISPSSRHVFAIVIHTIKFLVILDLFPNLTIINLSRCSRSATFIQFTRLSSHHRLRINQVMNRKSKVRNSSFALDSKQERYRVGELRSRVGSSLNFEWKNIKREYYARRTWMANKISDDKIIPLTMQQFFFASVSPKCETSLIVRSCATDLWSAMIMMGMMVVYFTQWLSLSVTYAEMEQSMLKLNLITLSIIISY